MGLEVKNTKKLAINKREVPAEQPRVFAAKRPSPQQPEYKDPDKVSLTSVCKWKRA